MSVSSCAVVSPETVNSTISDSPVATHSLLDETIGTYGAEREQRLILVTIESAVYAQMHTGYTPSQSPDSLPPEYASFIADLEARYRITRVADWPLAIIDIYCLVFEIEEAGDKAALLSGLSSEPRIETAQPMMTFDLLEDSVPDDPYLSLQHGYKKMQAGSAHRWSSGKGVTVAVIDTGMDTHHPDLQDRILGSRNFVDDDRDLFDQDIHGTAVAGVIAAAAKNQIGMAGIAPEANILALKACWQSGGQYRSNGCNTFTLAKALNYAITQSVDVINLSLAGPYDPLLERLLVTALAQNIVVVGASSPDVSHQFPGDIPGVITADFASSDESGDTEILAPGWQILSTRPNATYQFYSGSSFSAAHVSGLVALIKEHKPDWSSFETYQLLNNRKDQMTEMVNACYSIAFIIDTEGSVCSDDGASSL